MRERVGDGGRGEVAGAAAVVNKNDEALVALKLFKASQAIYPTADATDDSRLFSLYPEVGCR